MPALTPEERVIVYVVATLLLAFTGYFLAPSLWPSVVYALVPRGRRPARRPLRLWAGCLGVTFLAATLAGIATFAPAPVPGLYVQCPGRDPTWISQMEAERRIRVLAQLRQKYIFGHDGLSAGLLAGAEPLPNDWVDAELAALGENWC